MEGKTLNNKPLVEAIFELRWRHGPSVKENLVDKNYRLLAGSLYAAIKNEYPVYQTLPAAEMPDPISAHIVQHRFRVRDNEWPVIQVGPGVLTLNETEKYTWPDFSSRISKLIRNLFNIHPDPGNINVVNTSLRYIDAIEFDYTNANVFDFLKDKMKIGIKIPDGLFKDTGVGTNPEGLDLRFAFPSKKPEGIANVRFYKGQKRGVDALIWDTIVITAYPNGQRKTPEEIETWATEAHELTHEWFFKLIEGDLMREFE